MIDFALSPQRLFARFTTLFFVAVCIFAAAIAALVQGNAIRPTNDQRPAEGQEVKPPAPTDAEIKAWGCASPLTDLSSPTGSYKTLYYAVKCKNTEGIKNVLSKETIAFMTKAALMQKMTLDLAIGNGLSESTFSPSLPGLCQERLNGEMGALEVKRLGGEWEDLPFIREEGQWKLAVGDLFKGTYHQPSATICRVPEPEPAAPDPFDPDDTAAIR